MQRSGLLLSAMLLLTACGNFGLNEDQLMQRASQYMQEGDYKAAAIEVRNILQKNPDNAGARYMLAEISLDYGNFVTAEREYRLADRTSWGDGQARVGQLRSLFELGESRVIIDNFELDDGYPENVKADLLALRATAEIDLGEIDLAGITLQEAIALDPNAFQVSLAKIQMLETEGDLQQAISEAEAALENFPNNPNLLLVLADLSMLQGNSDGAKQLLNEVIENGRPGYISIYGLVARMSLVQQLILDENFSKAKTVLAPLYRRTANAPYINYLGGLVAFGDGDYDLAEQRLLKVMKVTPDHAPSRLLFATVNFAQQDFEQAAYFLSKYLFQNPDHLEARKLLGRSYMMLDQPGQARQALKPALSEVPGGVSDPELLLLVGFSELRSGFPTTGILAMERALAKESHNVSLRKELASIYMTTGETGFAIQELKALIVRGGNKRAALLIIGSLENGEFERAINLALNLLTNSPHDPAVISLTGNVFAASGDYKEARRYLNRALIVQPDFYPASLSLARLEELQGNEDGAISLYRKLVASNVDSVVPVLALARLERQQGDSKKLVNMLTVASKAYPDEKRPRLLLVEHYLREKQYKKAELILNDVADSNPDQPVVLYLQARLEIAQHTYKRAVATLTRLLEIDSQSTVARILLAQSYMYMGSMQHTRDELEKVLSQSPDDMAALALIVKLEIVSGNLNAAINYSKRLQQMYPDSYLGFQLMGDALAHRSDNIEADKNYSIAWSRMRRSDLAIKRAGVLLQLGDEEAALEPLVSWLKDHPADVRVRRYLATTYFKIGRPEWAIQEYLGVLLIAPDDVTVLNNLAWLYYQNNNADARLMAKRAYGLEPGNPGILDTYGWILVQQGDIETGLPLLKQASKQLPVADVKYHYAVALYRSGDERRARAILEKILTKDDVFDGMDEARQLLQKLSK